MSHVSEHRSQKTNLALLFHLLAVPSNHRLNPPASHVFICAKPRNAPFNHSCALSYTDQRHHNQKTSILDPRAPSSPLSLTNRVPTSFSVVPPSARLNHIGTFHLLEHRRNGLLFFPVFRKRSFPLRPFPPDLWTTPPWRTFSDAK
jgi:hypothetical protein